MSSADFTSISWIVVMYIHYCWMLNEIDEIREKVEDKQRKQTWFVPEIEGYREDNEKVSHEIAISHISIYCPYMEKDVMINVNDSYFSYYNSKIHLSFLCHCGQHHEIEIN